MKSYMDILLLIIIGILLCYICFMKENYRQSPTGGSKKPQTSQEVSGNIPAQPQEVPENIPAPKNKSITLYAVSVVVGIVAVAGSILLWRKFRKRSRQISTKEQEIQFEIDKLMQMEQTPDIRGQIDDLLEMKQDIIYQELS